MSFDWSKYLKLAEELNAQQGILADVEACQRSAISRAYYAAFHVAWEKAIILDHFMVTDDSRTHDEVKKHFQYSSDASRQTIGNLLDRLRRNRNKADYHDSVRGIDPLTSVSLAEAKTCIVDVQGLK